jgi:ABC-type nickel/cobalt efflux system permease component RcnA
MPDWLSVYLCSFQAGVMRGLAAEMRSGGVGTVALAFTLGAVHALTPGHGKAALAAYFLGKEARILYPSDRVVEGVRVTEQRS